MEPPHSELSPHDDRTQLVALALQNFHLASAAVPNFQNRPGQTHLACAIAETLSAADFDHAGQPTLQVLVAEAGTGTGKTAAFIPTALTLARAKGVRLVVSTATVALMEQLVQRDLPAIAKTFPKGFTFGLAKGRGRYYCPSKADIALGDSLQGSLDLDPDRPTVEEDAPTAAGLESLSKLADSFGKGTWGGDRDTVNVDVSASEWSRVAADRASCTGRHCSHFKECPYYAAKRELVKVDVIVTNHDLLLSSLVHGSGVVPTPDKAIYVIDEAHHLPGTAVAQSEASCDVSAPRWPQALHRACRLAFAAKLTATQISSDLPTQVNASIRELERACREFMRPVRNQRHPGPHTHRFEHGVVDPAVDQLARDALGLTTDWHQHCAALVEGLKESRSHAGANLERINTVLVEISVQLHHLSGFHRLLTLFVNGSNVRCAKWLSFQERPGLTTLHLHACPLTGASTLRQHLWSHARGVILTSATLRALRSFDFFLRETGLRAYTPRTELIESPFDYRRQGTILVFKTPASPATDQRAFIRALTPQLISDLEAVTHGALVLCSSRAMLDLIVESLPRHLMQVAQIQGKQARDLLLDTHRRRVASGKASILMGLASFGEGLDLPGDQCQSIHIPKLPFAMPTNPVEEARAEWVSAKGGDPFRALSMPATGLTLTQWVGRGIRTETDTATIIFYDPRLVEKRYGRQLLDGLPPFSREIRLPNGMTQSMHAPSRHQ